MAISDEERRRRDRERKRRNRAANKGSDEPEGLPRIGLGAADTSRTDEASADVFEDAGEDGAAIGSTRYEAELFVASLELSPKVRPLVPLLYRLADGLDGVFNVPQHASLAARYLEVMDRIIDEARPVEVDPLDEMRKQFYLGEVPGDVEDEAGVEAEPERREA